MLQVIKSRVTTSKHGKTAGKSNTISPQHTENKQALSETPKHTHTQHKGMNNRLTDVYR